MALITRDGFAVWRDETRLRIERALRRPISNSFLRLYHDSHLHPCTFVEEPGAHGERASWLGVPTWKLPSDMWVYQEILYETRPQLLVETGTQYGGSALFYASIFDLAEEGEVITIDLDTSPVYPQVRRHPRIRVIEGDSTAPEVVDEVAQVAKGRRTMVVLDSDHKQEHVTRELSAWPALVSAGCYLVVEDTALGEHYLPGWGGSLAAIDEWLPLHPDFERDPTREKFLASVNAGGYLRRRAS